MGERGGRRRAAALVVAVLLPACGGGGDTASPATTSEAPATTAAPPTTSPPPDTDAPATTAEPSPATTTGPVVPPPLLDDDGVVSEQALAAMLAADGQPDPVVLEAFAAEFGALPDEDQVRVVADLSMRAELEAAAISGLETAVGDRAATEEALTGAGTQVATQIDAEAAAAAQPPAGGLRRPPVPAERAPAPSAGAVATTGLFLGYLGLVGIGASILGATNGVQAGETDLRESRGTAIGVSVDEVDVELTFTGDQEGVAVDFVAATSIRPCPAPDGSFSIDALIDVKANKGGTGQNARMELKVTGTVGDDAELVDKQIENRTQWSDFGGGTNQFIDFTASGPNGYERTVFNRTGGTVTEAFGQLAVTLSVLFELLIVTRLLEATEAAWKSGRCVQLKVTPSAGPAGLEPSQSVTALAEPRSKVDGGPTGGTVTALLTAGATAVDPSSTPLPADATFTYTAADQPDQTGTVAFEARSRRGIGKATVTFATAAPAAYLVVGGLQDWQVNEVVCDVTKPFTLTAPGVGVANFSGGLTGSYDATGVFGLSYAGTYVITLDGGLGSAGSMLATSGGQIAGEAGSGTEVYSLTPATC